jgi:hypothetical protein
MNNQHSPRVIVVFTGKSLETILRDGGSQSWKLNPHHAKRCEFLVCCRSGVDWVQGPEPKGSAFLLGRVSGVEESTDPESPGRWLIKISNYAQLDIPDLWQRNGGRNPVRYTTLEDLGIDPTTQTFHPVPPQQQTNGVALVSASGRPLTIADAKRGLAETFGVNEEAVEITIHG